MDVLHSKETEKEPTIELSCEQKEKVLNLVDVSLNEHAEMVNIGIRFIVKLNIICFILIAIVLSGYNRNIINVINDGPVFKDWRLFVAFVLVQLPVRGLYGFCIRPLFDLYFGDLSKLRKYISKDKVHITKGAIVCGDGMDNTSSDIAEFKLMLEKRGLMYSRHLAKHKFDKHKEDGKSASNLVIFQDVDSLIKQTETGECLMLCCKPFGKRREIILATSL